MNSKEEQAVMDGLVSAWNAFVQLKPLHPDDLPDFKKAIHDAQRILESRAWMKLTYPDEPSILVKE